MNLENQQISHSNGRLVGLTELGWADVPTPVFSTNGQNRVSIMAEGFTQFFRLMK